MEFRSWCGVTVAIAMLGVGGGCQAFLDAMAQGPHSRHTTRSSSSGTSSSTARAGGAASTNETWAERSTAAATTWLLANRPAITQSVVNLTHPSGRDISWNGGTVLAAGEMLQIRINVGFTGSWSRKAYQTTVLWELTSAAHQRAVVFEDNAPVQVAPENARKLDNWFRSEMYAKLRSQLPN